MPTTITEAQVTEYLSTISQVLSDQNNVNALSQAISQNWSEIYALYQQFSTLASTLDLTTSS